MAARTQRGAGEAGTGTFLNAAPSLAARFPTDLHRNPTAIPVPELPLFSDLPINPDPARRPPAESIERILVDGHELLVNLLA